jgi:hypothetical protein
VNSTLDIPFRGIYILIFVRVSSRYLFLDVAAVAGLAKETRIVETENVLESWMRSFSLISLAMLMLYLILHTEGSIANMQPPCPEHPARCADALRVEIDGILLLGLIVG